MTNEAARGLLITSSSLWLIFGIFMYLIPNTCTTILTKISITRNRWHDILNRRLALFILYSSCLELIFVSYCPDQVFRILASRLIFNCILLINDVFTHTCVLRNDNGEISCDFKTEMISGISGLILITIIPLAGLCLSV